MPGPGRSSLRTSVASTAPRRARRRCRGGSTRLDAETRREAFDGPGVVLEAARRRVAGESRHLETLGERGSGGEQHPERRASTYVRRRLPSHLRLESTATAGQRPLTTVHDTPFAAEAT